MPNMKQDLPSPKKRTAMEVAKEVMEKKPVETEGIKYDDELLTNNIGGIKLAVYGRGKTGKTRLATSFPKPLLLIGTEDGTKSIATGKKRLYTLSTGTDVMELYIGKKPIGVHFCRLNSVDDLRECIEILKDPTEFVRNANKGEGYSPSYQSCALDHGGGLQALMVKEYLDLPGVLNQNSFGMMDKEQWGAINLLFNNTVEKLLNLAESHDMNIVVVAHERNFKDEGGNKEELIKPMVSAALTPGSCNWLNGACDYFCQMLIRQRYKRTEEKAVDDNGKYILDPNTGEPKTVINVTPVKGVDYCLRIGAHAIYQTGFRTVLTGELPDVIVNPTYDKIVQVICGELPDER